MYEQFRNNYAVFIYHLHGLFLEFESLSEKLTSLIMEDFRFEVR